MLNAVRDVAAQKMYQAEYQKADRIRQQKKQYREMNRAKLSENAAMKVCCDGCGRRLRIGDMAAHKRSAVHQRAIAALGVQV
jgi:hypothetical protein